MKHWERNEESCEHRRGVLRIPVVVEIVVVPVPHTVVPVQVPNAQVTEALGLRDTCEHRRGALRIPVAVETAVEPVPHTVDPAQVPNEQAAVRMAINSTPEVDVSRITVLVDLPVVGDDLRMSNEVVENAGVQDRNLAALKLLAKLVALDDLAVLLVRGEVKLDLREIEFKLTFANMFLDRPLVLLPRLRHAIAREIDNMLQEHDLGVSAQDLIHSFHTADFVEQRFHLTKCHISILH